MLRRSTVIAIWLVARWACTVAPVGIVEITAGESDRRDTPVCLALPKGMEAVSLQLQEKLEHGTRSVSAQVEPGEPLRLWWVLDGRTAAGSKRVYILSAGATREAPSAVTMRKDEAKATLLLHEHPVLSYQYAVLPAPPGASDRFKRSGFIHPLWSPSGKILTRIQPPDHFHHLGLWGPWTKTEYEGHHIDFWNLNQGEGTVRFVRFLKEADGPVFGGFEARQDHVWLKAPEGERVVLKETLAVRVWDQGQSPAWLMDYTSTYRCATESPLLLQAYRYGGLGFRGTAEWNNSNSDYLTSEGKTRRDGDGTRARWCDVYGQTGQEVEGLLFMSYPENQEHPEPMRIWPPDTNHGRGDVFFNFCPVRHADWALAPGRDYVLRYRLYAHEGKLTAKEAERLWQDFAYPPTAKLRPVPARIAK